MKKTENLNASGMYSALLTTFVLNTMTSDKIKALRRQAHQLKPIIWIGKQGLSETLHTEIEQALEHHELIKIKVLTDEREYCGQIMKQLCQNHQAEVIQQIGRIFVLYRLAKDI